MPAWPNRSSSAADQCGSTVEHMTKVLPGFMAAAAPPAPNSTDSVCAASTTTLTTTAQAAATSAGLFHATPPPPPSPPRLGGVFGGGPPPAQRSPPPRPAADRTHALHSRWHAASVRCLHPWRPSRRFLLFSWGWLPF